MSWHVAELKNSISGTLFDNQIRSPTMCERSGAFSASGKQQVWHLGQVKGDGSISTVAKSKKRMMFPSFPMPN